MSKVYLPTFLFTLRGLVWQSSSPWGSQKETNLPTMLQVPWRSISMPNFSCLTRKHNVSVTNLLCSFCGCPFSTLNPCLNVTSFGKSLLKSVLSFLFPPSYVYPSLKFYLSVCLSLSSLICCINSIRLGSYIFSHLKSWHLG